MLASQALDNIQLSAISRLFSSSVVQEMARKGKSSLLSRLARESSILPALTSVEPVRTLFDAAFSLLKKKNYRHEYVYKAALTHKVLLGKHSIHTATMLNEFRVGNCKADIAILNGTAAVYEIKSERDNLSRLEQQIASYRDVFAKVNIITGEKHYRSVLAVAPQDVGILLLTNRFQIKTAREAIDAPERTVPKAIFDSIQLHEAKKILEFLDIETPEVANTEMYRALCKLFIKLDSCAAHEGMVRILKKTRSSLPLAQLIGELPESLQTAVLTTPLRKQDYGRLLGALDTPIHEALNWS